MRERGKAFGSVGLLIVALALLGAQGARADEGCSAKVAAELASQEPSGKEVRLVFDVSLEASCACSSVTYDLVLEELLPNKQWKAVRETRTVEVHGATGTDRVEHRMSSDIKLIGHSVKAVESTTCEPDPASPA